MTTAFSTAVGAIVASLQSAPAVSANVDRTRLRPWKSGVDSAIVVRPIRSDVVTEQPLGGGIVSWDAIVSVECYARASAGTPADAAVDAVLAGAYGRLMSDQTLGGAVRWIEPQSITYDFDVDDQATACAVIQFLTRLTTAATNL